MGKKGKNKNLGNAPKTDTLIPKIETESQYETPTEVKEVIEPKVIVPIALPVTPINESKPDVDNLVEDSATTSQSKKKRNKKKKNGPASEPSDFIVTPEIKADEPKTVTEEPKVIVETNENYKENVENSESAKKKRKRNKKKTNSMVIQEDVSTAPVQSTAVEKAESKSESVETPKQDQSIPSENTSKKNRNKNKKNKGKAEEEPEVKKEEVIQEVPVQEETSATVLEATSERAVRNESRKGKKGKQRVESNSKKTILDELRIRQEREEKEARINLINEIEKREALLKKIDQVLDSKKSDAMLARDQQNQLNNMNSELTTIRTKIQNVEINDADFDEDPLRVGAELVDKIEQVLGVTKLEIKNVQNQKAFVGRLEKELAKVKDTKEKYLKGETPSTSQDSVQQPQGENKSEVKLPEQILKLTQQIHEVKPNAAPRPKEEIINEIVARDMLMDEINKVLDTTKSEIIKVQKQQKIISNLETELHKMKATELSDKLTQIENEVAEDDATTTPPSSPQTASSKQPSGSASLLDALMANVAQLKKVQAQKQQLKTDIEAVAEQTTAKKIEQVSTEEPKISEQKQETESADALIKPVVSEKVKDVKNGKNKQPKTEDKKIVSSPQVVEEIIAKPLVPTSQQMDTVTKPKENKSEQKQIEKVHNESQQQETKPVMSENLEKTVHETPVKVTDVAAPPSPQLSNKPSMAEMLKNAPEPPQQEMITKPIVEPQVPVTLPANEKQLDSSTKPLAVPIESKEKPQPTVPVNESPKITTPEVVAKPDIKPKTANSPLTHQKGNNKSKNQITEESKNNKTKVNKQPDNKKDKQNKKLDNSQQPIIDEIKPIIDEIKPIKEKQCTIKNETVAKESQPIKENIATIEVKQIGLAPVALPEFDDLVIIEKSELNETLEVVAEPVKTEEAPSTTTTPLETIDQSQTDSKNVEGSDFVSPVKATDAKSLKANSLKQKPTTTTKVNTQKTMPANRQAPSVGAVKKTVPPQGTPKPTPKATTAKPTATKSTSDKQPPIASSSDPPKPKPVTTAKPIKSVSKSPSPSKKPDISTPNVVSKPIAKPVRTTPRASPPSPQVSLEDQSSVNKPSSPQVKSSTVPNVVTKPQTTVQTQSVSTSDKRSPPSNTPQQQSQSKNTKTPSTRPKNAANKTASTTTKPCDFRVQLTQPLMENKSAVCSKAFNNTIMDNISSQSFLFGSQSHGVMTSEFKSHLLDTNDNQIKALLTKDDIKIILPKTLISSTKNLNNDKMLSKQHKINEIKKKETITDLDVGESIDLTATSLEHDEHYSAIFKEFKQIPQSTFISTACNVCKILLNRYMICYDCKMIAYCKEDHLRQDYLVHKDLCTAIQLIAKRRGGHIYNNAKNLNVTEYQSLQIHTIDLCERIINRKLSQFETQILLYPRMCATQLCREWRPSRLNDCSDCHMVSFCNMHPLIDDDHGRYCKAYELYYKINVRQQFYGQIEVALPYKVFKRELKLVNKNMDYVLKSLYRDTTALKDDCVYSELMYVSTAPLTSLYACQMANVSFKHQFVIHLVGAEMQFEVYSLDKWELFFLHMVPMVSDLLIVFIGPELNNKKLPLDVICRTRLCLVCRNQEHRRLHFDFQCNKLYHDYVKGTHYVPPDLICLFNPLLSKKPSVPYLNTWPETIKEAINTNACIAVTGLHRNDTIEDLEMMRKCNDRLQVILEPTTNPFASARPERGLTSIIEFKNMYIFITKLDNNMSA